MSSLGEITQLQEAMTSARVPATTVVQNTLDAIAHQQSQLNAFVDVLADRALQQAASIDQARQQSTSLGPLAGVPFAVKNLFDVAGLPTLAGSKINRDRLPATRDAALVRRLTAAGGVLVGTLNMDEYAYGFTTENTHYGATHNPHDLAYIAGGSSGGSAAAVAAGLVPLALGSDTNGSIRVPAALCGVYGLKPTYGRLSRAGTFPFVASLDHVGPFARSVDDLAIAYDLMQGYDGDDPVSRRCPIDAVRPRLHEGAQGLRIALADGYFEHNAEPGVYAMVQAAAQALGVQTRVDLPHAAQARAAAFILTAVEGGQLHLPNLRTRPQDFEPLIIERLLANTMIPAAWYVQAQRLRRWYAQAVKQVFETVDVILAPTTPRPAVRIGQATMQLRGTEVLSRPNMGLLTQPISFIGLPVVNVPIGLFGDLPDLARPMPVGMQIMAAPGCEVHCFRVAAALERLGISRCIAPEKT